jgi:hypothetical protein
VSKVEVGDLAYTVEQEVFEAKVGGRADVQTISLRVTSVFRTERGEWNLAHRHADPITSARESASVVDPSHRGCLDTARLMPRRRRAGRSDDREFETVRPDPHALPEGEPPSSSVHRSPSCDPS